MVLWKKLYFKFVIILKTNVCVWGWGLDYAISLLKTLYELPITLRTKPKLLPYPSISPDPFHPSHIATLVIFQFFEQIISFLRKGLWIYSSFYLDALPPLLTWLSNSHPLNLTLKILLQNSPTPHSYFLSQSSLVSFIYTLDFVIILFV